MYFKGAASAPRKTSKPKGNYRKLYLPYLWKTWSFPTVPTVPVEGTFS